MNNKNGTAAMEVIFATIAVAAYPTRWCACAFEMTYCLHQADSGEVVYGIGFLDAVEASST
jgi:hypothetical protein